MHINGGFFHQWKLIINRWSIDESYSKRSNRLFIDFQYQSIDKYRLVLIDIDTHRLSIYRLSTPGVFVMPNGAIRIKIPPFDSNRTNYGCQMHSVTIKNSILAIYGLRLWKPSEIVLCLWCYSECISTLRKLEKYPGIFFMLSRCGYTLRVTSQTSYSPEYTIEIGLYWIDKLN
jgi:hypothetical protein